MFTVGPSGMGGGIKAKIVWFTCRPCVQWRCRAYELYDNLLKRGLLNEYTPTDDYYLNNYIVSLEKDKFYWVTQLRDIIYQEDTVLTLLLPQDMIPRSSLICPRLKLETKVYNILLNFFGYLPNKWPLLLIFEVCRDHDNHYQGLKVYIYMTNIPVVHRQSRWGPTVRLWRVCQHSSTHFPPCISDTFVDL
jgi:hypothetical protein